jgi:hypothetical protein
MTPQELLNSAGIQLADYSSGRHGTTCPHCSHLRKLNHQKLRCLWITINGERAYWGCNHCGWTGPERGARDPCNSAAPDLLSYGYGDGLRKVRNTGGGFFWQHRNGKGGWEKGAAGADTSALLYRIDEVREAILSGKPVLVAEGEKDANTCWKLGFAATCNAHGASQPGKAPKWTAAHSEQLRGADVVVLGDNDAPGRAHVAAICKCTFGVAKSVRTIDLAAEWPELPAGGDISDWAAWAGPGAESRLGDLVNEAGTCRPEDSAEKPPNVPVAIWNEIAWDGVEVPSQQWTVPDLIPANEVCLFSGYGGGGKSTVGLQLAAAHARGMNWLNAIPEQGPAFFIDAEDHIDVIHRRLAAITRLYGCSYQDLIDGGLRVMSLHGKDAVMATADRNGVIRPTPLFETILKAAITIKPIQIIIAPSSHVYSGSEIDRSQVTQFVSLLSQLAVACGGSVILISHPSLTGMTNQSGISGSTGWHNAVRARMYLETLKNGDGQDQQPEHELRVLRFLKNQYGPPAREIPLRYQNGLFLPERQPTDYEKASKEAKVDIVFMDLMQSCKGLTPLSPNQFARNYAPSLFVKLPLAAGIKKVELVAAMERLLKRGTLQIKTWGPPSKQAQYLEIVE